MNKLKKEKTIIIIGTLFAVSMTIAIISNAQAQVTVTQKSFFFGENPTDTLMGRQYQDGTDISYDVSGYPAVVVTIHRWNDIGTVERNLIRSQLVTEGYEEQPEVDSQTGIIRETLAPR